MTGLEALERYHRLDVLVETDKDLTLKDDEEYKILKQALLKAQEQEKVLEIMFEKRIDLESFYITFIENDYDYNYYEKMYGTYGKYKLTEEEFDLLKRYLNETIIILH